MFKKRNIKNSQLNLSELNEQNGQQKLGEPHKKVKIQKPILANSIGGSTAINKLQTQQLLHKQLQNINYKKGKNESNILNGDEALSHETEQAKKKYLENVEITKKIKQGKLSTKIYRGINNYANYKLNQDQLQNPGEHYKWKHGPIKDTKSGTSKNTCRFDYDPSLCKDWHDTGSCSFGNSCIYLHDRSNYKTGWQLEKDFQKSQRQRWKRIMNPSLNDQSDYLAQLDKFKPQQICKYCMKQLKQPVQVSCKHILCRKCADQILTKDSKCPQCNKLLNGIMNSAQKSIQKQKQSYNQMMKTAIKNEELNKIRKVNKQKNLNSLDVFI